MSVNNNKACNEELDLMDVVNNDDLELNPDYFPSWPCGKSIYSVCDKCSYVLCKDHLTLGTCDYSHNIDSFTSNANDSNRPKPANPRDYQKASCEIGNCETELFAACPLCYRFLCFDHLDKSDCENDHQIESRPTVMEIEQVTETPKTRKIRPKKKKPSANPTVDLEPESFEVEGTPKEGATVSVTQRKLKSSKN